MKKSIQVVVSTPIQNYIDSDGVERKVKVLLSSGMNESDRREILKKTAEKQKPEDDTTKKPTK